MRPVALGLVFAVVVGMAASPGCASVEQGRVTLASADAGQFSMVSDALAPHCATLDCHGQVGRNLRLYWSRGLRVSPDDRPGEGDTTPDEYQQNYRSVRALEPYKLDAVRKGSAPAESLLIVRKARGIEDHKGGAPLLAGSDPDRCLVSWLKGTVDEAACKSAVGP